MEAEKDIFLIVSEHKRQNGSNFVFSHLETRILIVF